MKNNPYLLRALYIILVPMVLLIILLNTGIIQRYLPAASVDGESFSVVRYNYYFYDYQTTYLNAHEDELDELGYNPDIKPEKQDHPSGMNWLEFFQIGAEANMAETAYYCTLAEQAGYQFSEAELAPIAERVAANAEFATNTGISLKNYYIAYFGSGMSEERYTEELTRVVKAQAYKAYLTATCPVEQSAIDAYVAQNPDIDYRSVQLQVISVSALPDRATGAVGQPQLDALASKLEALVERYESGVPFDQLQRIFSEGKPGVITLTRTSDLPEAFARHYIDPQAQPDADIGEKLVFIDEQAGVGYFAIYTGMGEPGRTLDAHSVLSQQIIQQQLAQAIKELAVERNTFGMLLAAS